jgi:hypothetical protein
MLRRSLAGVPLTLLSLSFLGLLTMALGCQPTALLVEVTADQAQLASMDLYFFAPRLDGNGKPTGQLEQLQLSEGTQVNLEGRDLSQSPYRLLVKPDAETGSPVSVIALAATQDGQLLGGSLDGMSFIDGTTVRYVLHLTAAGGKIEPPLDPGVAQCRLADAQGERLVSLCDPSCTCADALTPGCGYLRGGSCTDFDGDGCPDSQDLDPTRPSADCAMCVDNAPCAVGSCPGLLTCDVGAASALSACRVDTQAAECQKLACPAPGVATGALYVDDVPCFATNAGGDCVQGRRTCQSQGQGWKCVPVGGRVDPFLCPFYDRCEQEASQPDSTYGSPATCLLDPKAAKLSPPITFDGRDYAYGELLATTGCPATCQLTVDISGLLDAIENGHGLQDRSTATCCFDVTGAVLGQNASRCRMGQTPTQTCDAQQTILITQENKSWYLAIDVEDGGDLHRFVFVFDAGSCQDQGTADCQPQAVTPKMP